ncbi:hypothetical protein ACSTJA_23715, partial [Vibrio parahaemolyticus]
MSRLAHGGLVTALAWSADSRLLATGSTKTLMHGVTRILEVATGKEVARF